jgi:hypothetical protein
VMMEAGAVRSDSPTCEGFWVLLCFVFKGEEVGFYHSVYDRFSRSLITIYAYVRVVYNIKLGSAIHVCFRSLTCA